VVTAKQKPANGEIDLQQAEAAIQEKTNARLRECNDKVMEILDEYGLELTARVTIAGTTISIPVTYQRKG